jgi:hypothetical protein
MPDIGKSVYENDVKTQRFLKIRSINFAHVRYQNLLHSLSFNFMIIHLNKLIDSLDVSERRQPSNEKVSQYISTTMNEMSLSLTRNETTKSYLHHKSIDFS